MENMKLTVTQEKREYVIDTILNVIEEEFDGAEVTAVFTKALLEEAIRTVEKRCCLVPLKYIKK
ncbi:hypothetical protein [Clostridium sp. BSD9I1]|uniref:hypothetical protein n=1 Tax=Clostridium sp. BSD9I1 TaxID=2003589 RepID=UPI001645EB75|nr:hypothetical protein [Clostridium sp. BSD9I1]